MDPNKPIDRLGRQALVRVGSTLLALFLLFALSGGAVQVRSAPAQPVSVDRLYSPSEVIAAVNQVRAASGLPPFQTNAALMSAAQAHSEYMASIGSTSHTGAGGSSILSRAVAAGYGGGAAVSVIENVWGGGSGSAQQAVNWWKNDGAHLATLISTKHQDVGAGVASGGGGTYYTLDVGAVTGAPGSAETQMAWSAQATSQPSTGETDSGAAAADPASSLIQLSTPGADGAVIHEVQPGETVWTIAASYDVSIAEVLRINGLNANSSYIVPGQKLVIQPAGTLATATFALQNAEGTPIDAEETALPPTQRPTRTPRLTLTALANLPDADGSPGEAPAASKPALEAPPKALPVDPVLLLIGGFVIGGAALFLVGGWMKRSA